MTAQGYDEARDEADNDRSCRSQGRQLGGQAEQPAHVHCGIVLKQTKKKLSGLGQWAVWRTQSLWIQIIGQ